jgi:chromosome segregation ATPase
MITPSRHNQGDLTTAELTLQKSEKELQEIRGLIAEKRTELAGLDANPQRLNQSGDISRLLSLKLRTVDLEKSIVGLRASEAECVERVESARRHLYSLYVRLERLRLEAEDLGLRLTLDGLPEESQQEIVRSLRRVKIQIEAIAGAE